VHLWYPKGNKEDHNVTTNGQRSSELFSMLLTVINVIWKHSTGSSKNN